MLQEIEIYLEKYPPEIAELFRKVREILFSIREFSVSETMWAKLPSYYLGEKFVRIIPFKDHLNIEASALSRYSGELQAYKFTPKGMMQLRVSQELPAGILKKAFTETLKPNG